jgi:hypothetical protein
MGIGFSPESVSYYALIEGAFSGWRLNIPVQLLDLEWQRTGTLEDRPS